LKNFIIFLLVALLAFSLIGCTRHTENHLRTYRDFLNYSLDNYRLVDTRTERQSSNPTVPDIHIFTQWELAYERYNGEPRTFVFTNRHDTILYWTGLVPKQEVRIVMSM